MPNKRLDSQPRIEGLLTSKASDEIKKEYLNFQKESKTIYIGMIIFIVCVILLCAAMVFSWAITKTFSMEVFTPMLSLVTLTVGYVLGNNKRS